VLSFLLQTTRSEAVGASQHTMKKSWLSIEVDATSIVGEGNIAAMMSGN